MPQQSKTTQVLQANGVDEEQARLIDRAIGLGRSRQAMISQDTPALRSVRRSFFSGRGSSRDHRAFHTKVNSELRQLSAEEIAFGDIPDWVREQHSAFCWNMYQGFQTRYLDRHEDETVNEFLDRPNKATLNVTKVVIGVLAKLYHSAPQRNFDVTVDAESPPDDPDEARKAVLQRPLQERLSEIWASKLFNRTMIDLDKYVRLLGTVAIRPIYDPDVKGKIRNWLFMSHQLRVIPDPTRPWRPAAVVERVHPFADPSEGGLNMNVWTDRYVVNLNGREMVVEEHGLGKIPHVFVRDALSWNSFFVEGRGRTLCEPNAVLNNDLSDLEEVKQMQGFSQMEVVNPLEDDIRVGPRQQTKFRVPDNTTPFGINFKAPNAPLGELRSDIEAQLRRIFMVNDVPVAALGAAVDQRALSGEAIRAAMQPISDDLEERESLFSPVEIRLADSMLRVISRHEEDFHYQEPVTRTEKDGEEVTDWVVPPARVVTFTTKYSPLAFPKSTRDQVLKDDFDVAQGVTTPAALIRREDPDDYPTHESAVEQWKKNLAETATMGFAPGGDTDDEAAVLGGLQAVQANPGHAGLSAEPEDPTPLLSLLEGADLVRTD